VSLRISLALLAYNQARCIDEAVRSALAQVCEPIEIILSDDCSTDDTFDRMQALVAAYRGPHEVVLRRNEVNLGIGTHFTTLMGLARGALVFNMAGDDISLPNRVARIAQAWDESGQRLDLIASHLFDMTEQGEDRGVIEVDRLQDWRGLDDWIEEKPYVVGAAHALTPRLFERFGPLGAGVSNEDQVTTFRALLSGGAHTVEEPLVRYRRGGLSSGAFQARDFRNLETRLNRVHLAVCAQWEQDARVAGVERHVRDVLDWHIRWELFVKRLLEARTLREQVATVRSAREFDPVSRWKRLVKLRWPRLTLMVRQLKKIARIRER
jgi:glycosyltransferase involved in cell wall biosynthesis